MKLQTSAWAFAGSESFRCLTDWTHCAGVKQAVAVPRQEPHRPKAKPVPASAALPKLPEQPAATDHAVHAGARPVTPPPPVAPGGLPSDNQAKLPAQGLAPPAPAGKAVCDICIYNFNIGSSSYLSPAVKLLQSMLRCHCCSQFISTTLPASM